MSPEHLRAFFRSHEWQEVQRLFSDRSCEAQKALRRMDPLKDATAISRQQGRLEVYELLLDPKSMVEALGEDEGEGVGREV